MFCHSRTLARRSSDGCEPTKRQAELTVELEKPETYAQSGRALGINRALQGVLADVERLTADWESAAARLTELEVAQPPS